MFSCGVGGRNPPTHAHTRKGQEGWFSWFPFFSSETSAGAKEASSARRNQRQNMSWSLGDPPFASYAPFRDLPKDYVTFKKPTSGNIVEPAQAVSSERTLVTGAAHLTPSAPQVRAAVQKERREDCEQGDYSVRKTCATPIIDPGVRVFSSVGRETFKTPTPLANVTNADGNSSRSAIKKSTTPYHKTPSKIRFAELV